MVDFCRAYQLAFQLAWLAEMLVTVKRLILRALPRSIVPTARRRAPMLVI